MSTFRKVWLRRRPLMFVAAIIIVIIWILPYRREYAQEHTSVYTPTRSERSGIDVVAIAQAYPEGGGWNAKVAGVPESIICDGKTLMTKSEGGTHCSGFTFAVVMRAAQTRGLLDSHSFERVRQFQREWYGSVRGLEEEQGPAAMQALGIGSIVPPLDAQPGNFVQFWRIHNSGHSVIFLSWVRRDDKIIGFRYRSSQASTNGVGEQQEYFKGSGIVGADVDPDRFYVGHLN